MRGVVYFTKEKALNIEFRFLVDKFQNTDISHRIGLDTCLRLDGSTDK
jgi:hypothetical protein